MDSPCPWHRGMNSTFDVSFCIVLWPLVCDLSQYPVEVRPVGANEDRVKVYQRQIRGQVRCQIRGQSLGM